MKSERTFSLSLIQIFGFYSLLSFLLLAPALLSSRVLLPADLLATTLPFSRDSASPAWNPYLSDVVEMFYPYLDYFLGRLREGDFPLWNPHLLNGTPFLATSVNAVLSPLNLLLLLFPLPLFFEWSAFLKLVLAGAGIHLFSRRLGVSEGCALLAGAGYLFAGYGVFFLLFANAFIASLLGWGLLLLEGYLQEGSRRQLFLWGLLLGAVYLAGHVESALLQHLSYLLYALLRRPGRFPQVALVSLLGFTLAAVMILPFLEFLFHSATYLQRTAPPRNPYYLAAWKWPALLIPYYLGSPLRPPQGAGLEVMEGSAWVGFLPLLLMTFTWSRRGRGSVRALWGVWTAALLILFGVPPFFDLFTLPPLLRQGNHFHVVQVLQAFSCILAGIGLSCLLRGEVSRRRFQLTCLLFALAAGWAWLAQVRGTALTEEGYYFLGGRSPWPVYAPLVLLSCLLLPLFFRRRLLLPLCLGMVVLNGFLAGLFFHPIVPVRFLRPSSATLDLLLQHPGERFLGVGVATLTPNYAMLWGLRDVRGYESLLIERLPAFYSHLTGGRFEPHQFVAGLSPREVPLLRRLGCSLILSPEVLDLPGLVPLKEDFPYVYRLTGSARVQFARRIRCVRDGSQALQHLLLEPDPRYVVLEAAEDLPVPSEEPQGRIRWLEDDPDRVSLEVSAEKGGWLVLRDTLYPGWQALLDGEPISLYRADYLFRAVFIPAGTHNLVFEFRPRSFRLGLGLSLLGLLALAVFLRPWKS